MENTLQQTGLRSNRSRNEEPIPRDYWVRAKIRAERTVAEMEKRLKDLSPSAHWSKWMCQTAIRAARRELKQANKELMS